MLRTPLAVALVAAALLPASAAMVGTAHAAAPRTQHLRPLARKVKATGTMTFSDAFSTLPLDTPWADGSVHGPWLANYDGYGTTEIADVNGSAVLSEQPETSTAPDETHAALVTSVPSFGDLTEVVKFVTVRQLRVGSPPNPWEEGWVLWHYTDDSHFYYVLLKPNGFELGKEDPSYPGGQRFLVTSATPTFPVGVPYTVTVTQVGGSISVAVDGKPLVSYTDTQSPYLTGHVGLYDEDAQVQFSSVSVSAAP